MAQKSKNTVDKSNWEEFLMASEEMGPSDAEVDALIAEMDEIQARLELRYRNRGLTFTSGFRGAMPVQAYGIVDGMRFYFRFRHGIAYLYVGVVDRKILNDEYVAKVERHKKKLAGLRANIDAGVDVEESKSRLQWLQGHSIVKEVPNGKTDYPNVTHAYGEAGTRSLQGTLTAVEAEEVFAACMENLSPV